MLYSNLVGLSFYENRDISHTPQQWMKMVDITLTEDGLIQRYASDVGVAL